MNSPARQKRERNPKKKQSLIYFAAIGLVIFGAVLFSCSNILLQHHITENHIQNHGHAQGLLSISSAKTCVLATIQFSTLEHIPPSYTELMMSPSSSSRFLFVLLLLLASTTTFAAPLADDYDDEDWGFGINAPEKVRGTNGNN